METNEKLMFSDAEIKEMTYCVNKELAWKNNQLIQLQKGIVSMSSKVDSSLKNEERTQEDWLKEKIEILNTLKSKIKAFAKRNKK